MASRVSWSVEGIDPTVRERAEQEARRSGMAVGDWINSQIGSGDAPQNVSEIHSRLDSIARQVDHMTGGDKSGVARQLNDAISRLDARLSQISGGAPRAPQNAPYQSAPPLSPQQHQDPFSIAEIVARQGELDGAPPRQFHQSPPMAPFVASPYGAYPQAPFPEPHYARNATPMPPSPDFSGLERQLSQITSQIETLRRPDSVEQSIGAFRTELAEIRTAITEAMPRRAIESLEGEVRALGKRIDENRENGVDGVVLSNLETALTDIRQELRSLTPAEQLAGFDEAIRNLGGKLDTIVRTSGDPGTIHQLEDAIVALRAITSNVASNEALHNLAEHIHILSQKVEQIARASGGETFSALEQRIAELTNAMQSREHSPGNSAQFDDAVRTISNRLDNLQVGGDASSLSHVEQRIHNLIERLEMSGSGGAQIARLEEGLSDVLRHLQNQRSGAEFANNSGDPALADTIKRELTDMRFNQSETIRQTQDSLEAVHGTLGHVVDRLAQIEGGIRSNVTAPQQSAAAAPKARAALPAETRPEMPNPAAAQAMPTPVASAPVVQNIASPPLAMKDISIPSGPVEQQPAVRPAVTPRAPIDASLPPDHPLEPGTRRASPSERIAASEGALSEIPSGSRDSINPTNFIQAARRAAQAAAAAAPLTANTDKPAKVTVLSESARAKPAAVSEGGSKITSKIRAVLVGASVVVIVLGTVRMAMNLLEGDDTPAATESRAVPPSATPSMPGMPAPMKGAPALPGVPPMNPFGKQSTNSISPIGASDNQVASAPSEVIETTGSISPSSAPPIAPRKTPVLSGKAIYTEQLPDAIGSVMLRDAALHGDPGAAYEIAARYAEGRGVAASAEDAAKWHERAAKGDIVPAIFRLGALYEKGIGVKKDIDAARRYYLQAAERGNAKAMHNLAVLEADGGTRGPNYKNAAYWFRKASDHGVADSEFNLAILYARGLGVEQNLAESYKWFSLAAAQGDADAGRKRDDIAKRLDAQSIAAAKLAVQTFTAEVQPNDAVSTGAPSGGWDGAPAKKPAKTAKSASVTTPATAR